MPGARALFGLAAVLAWGIVVDVATGSNTAGSIAGLVMTGASWGAGRWLRARRLLDAELARTAERIEAERTSRVRLAVADERTRIARELHTLIASNVSAMVLQAEAAELLLDADSQAADVAMAAIEQTGRGALADMRRMLGVLRHSEETPSLAPQPGVGQVYALVEAARGRGGSIELSVDGDPGPLPASVDLGLYRMLEETLTAERLERGVVRLRFCDDEVELEVSAYGLENSPPWPTLAMRERVAICQGTIQERVELSRQAPRRHHAEAAHGGLRVSIRVADRGRPGASTRGVSHDPQHRGRHRGPRARPATGWKLSAWPARSHRT